ncbi:MULTISPECIES: lytic transglycosylase domain-containing protein [unclassified Pseudomonas]|uniref:lytic transglycosylase domain-containing protein n=1 Tax=unclassified Pseudomonas TaxID=196821 RepID=UPI001A91F4F4|nr:MULTISPECIES: lytic transglycosylase domain-containing protein [unclassified Pseudomonas]
MIRWRRLVVGMGLLLACGPVALVCAQNIELDAPLTWTRGDLQSDISPAPATLVPPSSPPPSAISVAPSPPLLPYGPLIDSVAREYHLDPRLLHAMIHVESRYQQDAVSNKGAIGLMQVMPLTGARFGYTDLSNAPDNLRAGAAYLRWLLDHFDHNLELSIAAYNAGEGAVKKYGREIPPYPETQTYVTRVMARYRGTPMGGAAPDQARQSEVRATENPSTALRSAAVFLHTLGSLLLASPEHQDG